MSLVTDKEDTHKMITFERYSPYGDLKGVVDVYYASNRQEALDALCEAFPLHTWREVETDPGFRQNGDKALDARTGSYYDARDGVPA